MEVVDHNQRNHFGNFIHHFADVELRDCLVRFYHEHGKKMQSLNWLDGSGSVLQKAKDES